ncbi:MAG: nuclear transport factor 2 family protein [Pseudomonadota bacterium]
MSVQLFGAAALWVAALSPAGQAADHADVAAQVQAVSDLADRGDFAALEQIFAPNIAVNYSTLSGAPAATVPAKVLLSDWASLLPGFDRTHHVQRALTVVLDDDRAEVRSSVEADHWLDGAVWSVRGTYEFRLMRQAGEWRITAMTFILQDETGSRGLLTEAALRAADNPPAYLVEQEPG